MAKKKGGAGAKKSAKSEIEGHAHAPISLREEATGKLQTRASTNVKSVLKVEHLKKLAVWATAKIMSLRYRRLWVHSSASIWPPLQRPPECETVLHPGFNSTVGIEKSRSKHRRRHKKPVNNTQNNVVYKCHSCLHQNVKRGTPKGRLKGICPSRNKSSSESAPQTKSITNESSKLEKDVTCEDEANEVDVFASRVVAKDASLVDGPATPSRVSTTTSLEGKKRMRNSSTSKKAVETASMSAKSEVSKTQSTASKRRKRCWTSLKEFAQSNGHENSHVANLTIPLFL